MPDFSPGSVFAGHRIEGPAGRGGMGVVYRTTHLRLGRKVALKVIAPELLGDPSFKARFERESRLAGQLDHPHILPIHDAGEEDGLLYISMRYVEGTDLAELLANEGRLEPGRATKLVSQVAEALDEAHENELKPPARRLPPLKVLAPIVAVIALLAVGGVLYLTGFFGGGTGEPTEATQAGGAGDYVADVGPDVESADESIAALDDVTSSSAFSDDVAAFGAAEDDLDDLVATLEDTDPPSDADTEHDDLLDAANDLSDDAAAGRRGADDETVDNYPAGYPGELNAVADYEDALEALEAALGESLTGQ